MSDEVFIDTNVLVYAHDRQAGDKHTKARTIVEAFWRERRQPCLSVQVLQELHVNLVKKGVGLDQSAAIASRYLSWRVADNTRQLFSQALSIQQRWQLSFWDAHIIAAAQRMSVSELWTEDLNDGQDYGGVRVVNPFAGL